MISRAILLMALLVAAIVLDMVTARCPNWCNKRGECTSPSEGGYCVCHYGFTGEDCSQRLCPAGFDPVNLDTKPNRRTVRMEVGHMGGILMGKYAFGFAGSEVFMPANANDNDDLRCNAALKGLKSVETATCKRESFNPDTGAGSYLISLLSFPTKPYMNNIIHHNGNPGINLFACNTSKIDEEEAHQPFCFISDVEPSSGFPVYAECSNHGACDRVHGVCDCAAGFKGDNCQDMSDSEDIHEFSHDGPFFTASIVKLHAQRAPSAAFNLLQAQIDGHNLTTLRGDGLLRHEGWAEVYGGLTVGAPTVAAAGEGAESANIQSSIVKAAKDTPAASHHLLAYHNHQRVFTVSATGATHIAGSLQVGNASLSVDQHLITGQNLRLQNDLHVQGSANIEESLTIGAGFALMPGGMTVDVASHSGTLFELRSRQQGFNGTLMELNSVGDNNVLIKTISSGLTTFELASNGDVRMNGLHLASGGVQVQAGGIEVDAGGLKVHGGLSILSGGLSLPQQPFTVGSLQAITGAENLHRPLITATSTAESYVGDLLSLTATLPAPTGSTDGSAEGSAATTAEADALSFLNLQQQQITADGTESDTRTGTATSVFRVRGSGQIDSAAGAVFRGAAGLEVHGAAVLKGKVNLQRATLVPQQERQGQWVVTIPATATYVAIAAIPHSEAPEGTAKIDQVEARFDRAGADSPNAAGRVVLLSNTGEQTTTGDAAIPPHSTVLMLFDGQHWVSVDALKAPMHELKHVRTLEAANDLNVGNYTLSALRFRATGLHKNSIVFSSAEGFLADSDKLSYVKGVLTAPALRVEKVVSDIDVRGNQLSNAHLTNPKITGASIAATDITLSGATGLAYFSAKGALTASTALSLDSAGHLLITDTFANLNAHGHEIRNVRIAQANLTDIGSIKTAALYLTGSGVDSEGGLLMTTEGGRVVSAQGAIAINYETGNVAVKSLSAATLSGALDAKHHTISNAVLTGGSAKDLTEVTTNRMTVKALRDTSGRGDDDTGTSQRFVFANADGELHAQRSAEDVVSIARLSVRDLEFLSSEIDFQGRKVKNIVLDSDTFELGPQKRLQAEEVVLSRLGGISAEGSLPFLTTAEDGKIGTLQGVSYANGVLDVATSTVSAAAVRAQTLTLTGVKGAAVLGTDADGAVISRQSLDLDRVTAQKGVTITATAGVELQGREAYTLLSVNDKGEVVTVPKPTKNTDAAGFTVPLVDAHLRDLRATSAAVGTLTATKVSTDELHLTVPATEAGSGDGQGVATGSVLVQSKTGKVTAVSGDLLRIEHGIVHVAALQSASHNTPLHITNALITQSNLTNSHIHSANSVSTNTLSVREMAEFLSDVVVDGSLTVHGAVVGSGPYVDSSDLRLKKDVKNISSALDTVSKLRGVTYNFRTEEFPERSLPPTPQIGFIAQEVETVAPELVSTDQTGYKGVAYAHVTALLAEAVKELKTQHETEVSALKTEVAELKALVQLLLAQRPADGVA